MDSSANKDSPAPARWALGLAVLEGEDLKPVDSCEAANGRPLLAFARPLGGTLPNLSALRFCAYNRAGTEIWAAEWIAFPLLDRGEVCVSATALPPETTQASPGTLLRLESEAMELAVVPLSQSERVPAPEMPVPAEEEQKPEPQPDAEALFSECSDAISEWEQLSAECASRVRQLDAARQRLAAHGAATDASQAASTGSLLSGLLTGETEWIGKLRDLLTQLETGLDKWRSQLAVFGPDDSERARLLVLLRGAEQTRRFYQMDDWGWLKATENLCERRAMIETYLARDEPS